MAIYSSQMSALPEGCIANVLSFTTPQDACVLSLVSSSFRNAAESDVVWERFLPPDYRSILSSSDPSLLTPPFSKKQLFLTLCDKPILIDHGKKSFSLDKRSGKKCYTLSARDLQIVWGDTPEYWRWTYDPNSRFEEVAELRNVCWLEIRGKINTNLLSSSTMYKAYLVFKFNTRSHGLYSAAEAIVGVGGEESSKRSVYLDAKRGFTRRPGGRRAAWFEIGGQIMESQASVGSRENGGYSRPKERKDRLMEVELGEFFNNEGQNGDLEICISEVKIGHWKSGLVVHCIEIRPYV